MSNTRAKQLVHMDQQERQCAERLRSYVYVGLEIIVLLLLLLLLMLLMVVVRNVGNVGYVCCCWRYWYTYLRLCLWPWLLMRATEL